ncbi:GroES-like protein [Massarina eburnea CBS 473.64]|uniref:GroES-like protein n=1 Tax=Massarina eburnea CBS 473.64 TaxID=1395130 RepID=A0A6A6RVP7_9PLEO|nr:GroES-like protein [Massarina eburnea CBS 473.64]
MVSPTLPTHHRALQLQSIGHFQVANLPTPKAGHGSAVVKIEAAGILSYHREIYDGTRNYSFPTPIVGGYSAIGRIANLGPDATLLKIGQLVYVDCVIHARDDSEYIFLSAIHDSAREGSRKLMRDVWRDGTFAEYARMPLENCIPLNEARLCGGLGFSVEDLMYMGYLMVPFGGLRDIRLEPGETIVIGPATGGYGGAAVQVAIAMGARVIAIGRNEEKLAKVREHVLAGSPNASIETAVITGDEAADTATLRAFGTIDAILDLTPPSASKSTHLRSAMGALRRNGRVSMMGFVDNPMVPWEFVARNHSLKGKLMYERDDIVQFVKLLESGLFPKGERFVQTRKFQLEDWTAAFDVAAKHTGIGKHVVFTF